MTYRPVDVRTPAIGGSLRQFAWENPDRTFYWEIELVYWAGELGNHDPEIRVYRGKIHRQARFESESLFEEWECVHSILFPSFDEAMESFDSYCTFFDPDAITLLREL